MRLVVSHALLFFGCIVFNIRVRPTYTLNPECRLWYGNLCKPPAKREPTRNELLQIAFASSDWRTFVNLFGLLFGVSLIKLKLFSPGSWGRESRV